MTEKMQTDGVLSRQAVFVRCCLYGMRFEDGGKPVNGDWEHPQFSDRAEALYYRPHMIDGVIDVARYKEAMKC